MRPLKPRALQRGVATMFVTLVLLILITLMVVTAFSLSNINLKTVGNVQARKEAVASAQKAIEQVVDNEFWTSEVAIPVDVDVDGDDIDDYLVTIAVPYCIRATLANVSAASSVTLPGFSSASAWNTIWVLDAVATDEVSGSGTRVRVRQGVRVLLSDANKDQFCPT